LTPVLSVLLVIVAFSAFFGDPHLSKGWQAIGRTFFRFFRFSISLCLPLYLLVPIYCFIVEKMKKNLLQVKEKAEGVTTHRLKLWVLRPFQGLGLGLLFSEKLLAVLQLIAGPTIRPSLIIPRGQFEFELARFFLITFITVLISLLFSILWTLDDMGIRYLDRKKMELKMIGKYASTLLPTIFGIYGLFGLLSDYPTSQALLYAFKIIVVLYPPLAFFSIAHTYFLRRKAGTLSRRISLKKARIIEYE
jgi:hypothetical protein